jgi:hypothetical protein
MAHEPYLAWCIDEVVSTFGRWVEVKMSEQEEVKRGHVVIGHKPRWRMEQLLGTEKPYLPSGDELRAVLG